MIQVSSNVLLVFNRTMNNKTIVKELKQDTSAIFIQTFINCCLKLFPIRKLLKLKG